MLKPIAGVLFSFLVLGLGGAGLPTRPAEQAQSSEVMHVSMIQLVASPERFEGKRVQLLGYCRFGFEEHSLYLHREDSLLLNTANAVWLDTTERREDLNETFVRVEGTFTARDHGHLGLWPGALVQISRLERAKTR